VDVAQGHAGRLSARGARLLAIALLALAALLLLLAPAALRGLAASRLRTVARTRAWSLSWRELRVTGSLTLRIAGLEVRAAGGDTLCAIDSLAVAPDLLALLTLRARPAAVTLAHARIRARPPAAAADTLGDEDESDVATYAGRPDHAARVRAEATQLVRMLLLPARRLPRLEVRDVTIVSSGSGGPSLELAWLALSPARSGTRLAGAGTLVTDRRVPFDLELLYDESDRLAGGGRFLIPDPARRESAPLSATLEGRVTQNRRRSVLELRDSTRIQVGRMTFHVAGRIERAGPRFVLALDADHLNAADIRASIPAPLLGPLADAAVRGTFDYHAALDLDFARPDSVALSAEVVPHGLALDPANRLAFPPHEGGWTAVIHLPHGRLETRELSSGNPHFRTLDRIDSTLVHAVVTNEDGGFFHHRGFNLEAVRRSVAANIHAAAWRRGAGTISMQLTRNLYLGHERTLSRKAQEVVLTWLMEHLSGLDKARMLEIYLNVIEWGPGVLGADEAAQYYFGHDAGRVSVAEALFLATVLPSPAHWRWRFTESGELRDFERAQMHFIGRAMIAKGWLSPAALPEAGDLSVTLAGPARAELQRSAAIPAATPAPSDTLAN